MIQVLLQSDVKNSTMSVNMAISNLSTFESFMEYKTALQTALQRVNLENSNYHDL